MRWVVSEGDWEIGGLGGQISTTACSTARHTMHCGKLDFGKLIRKAWDGDGDEVADVHGRLKVAMGTISLQ